MQRVTIIGHTGRGNYVYGLDLAFVGVEDEEIVALADAADDGRMMAVQRTGAQRGYADYHGMLQKEQPDITVMATREIGITWKSSSLPQSTVPISIWKGPLRHLRRKLI